MQCWRRQSQSNQLAALAVHRIRIVLLLFFQSTSGMMNRMNRFAGKQSHKLYFIDLMCEMVCRHCWRRPKLNTTNGNRRFGRYGTSASFWWPFRFCTSTGRPFLPHRCSSPTAAIIEYMKTSYCTLPTKIARYFTGSRWYWSLFIWPPFWTIWRRDRLRKPDRSFCIAAFWRVLIVLGEWLIDNWRFI